MRKKDEAGDAQGAGMVSRALAKLLENIPRSQEPPATDPQARSRRLAGTAAAKAASVSAALSLPPGPLGMVTLVPDLLAIWRLQSQLVSDIAAAHGQTATLTRESMAYCLFKHGAAALLRDLVVRSGQRYIVRKASLSLLQGLLVKVGIRVTQQGIGKAVARYVPVLGALGVGAYAYYDTAKVGATAIALFGSEVEVRPAQP